MYLRLGSGWGGIRLQREGLHALLEYVRINKLNRRPLRAPEAKLGIVTTAKRYLDTVLFASRSS